MDLKNIKIEDPFWGHMQELVTDVVIPFQEDVLNDRQPGVEKSHAIENFKIAAGLSQGEFYGMVFQDSDVAKWLEGVAYSLIIKPDAALEKRADDIIDIIAAAQQPDGYLNTYFTIKEPEHRWQNLLECHELYCAGHMLSLIHISIGGFLWVYCKRQTDVWMRQQPYLARISFFWQRRRHRRQPVFIRAVAHISLSLIHI